MFVIQRGIPKLYKGFKIILEDGAEDYGPLAESFLRKYMDVVDRSFGIRYENGHFMMGDKILKVYGDNIMLDDEVYVGIVRSVEVNYRQKS